MTDVKESAARFIRAFNAHDENAMRLLNDPNGTFGSAAFGSITSAGNPRVFEFVGKVHF